MQSDQTPMGNIGVTGMTALLGQVATLGRTAQAIAEELAKLSEENINVSARAVEKLRAARTLQDVASIQTDLVRESIEKSQNHLKKIAEIAVAAPAHTVENYREFMASFTEATRETARRGAEQVGDAAHQATQEAGDAARRGAEQVADATRKAGDAAARTTENFADAARKSANG